jgi:hypothetical protein
MRILYSYCELLHYDTTEEAKLWYYVVSNNCILPAKSVSQYKLHNEKAEVSIALGVKLHI